MRNALLLISLILVSTYTPICNAATIKVRGYVLDEENNALPDVNVVIYSTSDLSIIDSQKTNASGWYEFNTVAEKAGNILAYYDDPTTQGFDYYPTIYSPNPEPGSPGEYIGYYNITLEPAASIEILGDFQSLYHDIEVFSYRFLALEEDEIIVLADIREFHTANEIHRNIIGLEENVVICHANVEFYLEYVGCYWDGMFNWHERDTISSIDVVNTSYILEQGSLTTLNITLACYHNNHRNVNDMLYGTQEALIEAEKDNYDSSNDWDKIAEVEAKIESAEGYYQVYDYDRAYTELQLAYDFLTAIKEDINEYTHPQNNSNEIYVKLIQIILGLAVIYMIYRHMKGSNF